MPAGRPRVALSHPSGTSHAFGSLGVGRRGVPLSHPPGPPPAWGSLGGAGGGGGQQALEGAARRALVGRFGGARLPLPLGRAPFAPAPPPRGERGGGALPPPPVRQPLE